MEKRRVAVTGLGAITPVGNDYETAFEALLGGRSGVSHIRAFDTADHRTKIAAEVKDFDPSGWCSPAQIRRFDPCGLFALAAAIEAQRDSGLDLKETDTSRVGVIAGSGVGGVQSIERQHGVFLDQGWGKLTPFDVTKVMINSIAAQISIQLGLEGPNWVTASACASAAHAIGMGLRTIQYGDADVILAGGADAAITSMIIGGFSRMRALSTRNDEPERASRPFDRDRDGFVMGEGSAFLMLENLEHAQRRGARIYCELAGFGSTSDAFHIAAPREDGIGAIRSMSSAMEDARLDREEVDYINAHGTSTLLNDAHEARAIRRVFGDHADALCVSSTKSMAGHLLGASGALEAIVCALSVSRGVVHPTLNLENPGEDCDLDFVPEGARETRLRAALSNSLGFGGHNCTLAFRGL